ncbi:MAG: hypothetical protein COC06_02290 [Bacteroidales bacterium]|nr:MAG: hypothetical protein COC06_02290 [Bacteroidales bacterium]
MQRIYSSQNTLYKEIFTVVCIVSMYAQSRIQVKGEILDQDNKPVAFASVALRTTGIGAICDQNGKFVINIPKQKNTKLSISSIGYKKKQVVVNLKNKTNLFISVRLKAKTTNIDEVTVRGQSIVQQINKTAYNVMAILLPGGSESIDQNDIRRVQCFNHTYHNESIMGQIGVVNKRWADNVDTTSYKYNWSGETNPRPWGIPKTLSESKPDNWNGNFSVRYKIAEMHFFTLNHTITSNSRTTRSVIAGVKQMTDYDTPMSRVKNITGFRDMIHKTESAKEVFSFADFQH